MKWFQEDEGMSPDEAKAEALGMLHMWLSSRYATRDELKRVLALRYRRVRRFANEDVGDSTFQMFTRMFELFCSMLSMRTLSKIFGLMERVKEIRDAIGQLLEDKPDLAIHLIADRIPPVRQNPAFSDMSMSSDGATDGLAYAYIRILHGLRDLKAKPSGLPASL